MISKFPVYLPLSNRTIKVLGYFNEVDNHNIGKGYIYNDYVRVYVDKIDKSIKLPQITISNDGNVYTQDVYNMEIFHVSNIHDVNYDEILKNTSKHDKYYDDQMLIDINSSTITVKVEINESDDFLKKVVKGYINMSGINIKSLKSKGAESYSVSNLIQGLLGKTKMSTDSFCKWQELLGFKFTLSLTGNGFNTNYSLDKDLSYESCNDKLSYDGNTISVNKD